MALNEATGGRAISVAHGFEAFCNEIATQTPVQVSSGGAGLRLDFADPQTGGFLEFLRINEDFILLLSDFTPSSGISLCFAGESWTRLHFRATGHSTMLFDESGLHRLTGAFSSLFHQPEGVICQEWFAPGAPLRILTLWCREPFLRAVLSDALHLAPRLCDAWSTGDSALLYFERMPLTAAMLRLFTEISASTYSGRLRTLYLEAKSLELICELLRLSGESRQESASVRLCERDRLALEQVYQLLNQRYAQPPSIEQLSRRHGLNRNKLTYGFRHLFGQSVGEFCESRRLEAGRRLLLSSDRPIQLIAEQVGYRHATNFATAFRRHFGESPASVRRAARREK